MDWFGLLAALLLAAASPTPPLDYTPCVDDTTAAGCPGTIQWDAGGGSMAWATGAIAIYAIWDYYRVAPHAGRRVGH